MVAADRGRDSNLPYARTYARRHVPRPAATGIVNHQAE